MVCWTTNIKHSSTVLYVSFNYNFTSSQQLQILRFCVSVESCGCLCFSHFHSCSVKFSAKKTLLLCFGNFFSPTSTVLFIFLFFIFALHLLCVSFLISLCIFVFLCAFVAYLYFSGLFLCCSLFDLSGPPYSALHIVGLHRKIHLTCTCIIWSAVSQLHLVPSLCVRVC